MCNACCTSATRSTEIRTSAPSEALQVLREGGRGRASRCFEKIKRRAVRRGGEPSGTRGPPVDLYMRHAACFAGLHFPFLLFDIFTISVLNARFARCAASGLLEIARFAAPRPRKFPHVVHGTAACLFPAAATKPHDGKQHSPRARWMRAASFFSFSAAATNRSGPLATYLFRSSSDSYAACVYSRF